MVLFIPMLLLLKKMMIMMMQTGDKSPKVNLLPWKISKTRGTAHVELINKLCGQSECIAINIPPKVHKSLWEHNLPAERVRAELKSRRAPRLLLETETETEIIWR